MNVDSNYSEFRTNAVALYADQLHQQNELDIELYDTVVRRLWDELHSQRLLQHAVVREYWKQVYGKLSAVDLPVT